VAIRNGEGSPNFIIGSADDMDRRPKKPRQLYPLATLHQLHALSALLHSMHFIYPECPTPSGGVMDRGECGWRDRWMDDGVDGSACLTQSIA